MGDLGCWDMAGFKVRCDGRWVDLGWWGVERRREWMITRIAGGEAQLGSRRTQNTLEK